MPGFLQWFLSLRFPHQNPVYASPLPIRATRPAHLILRDFITRTVVGGQYMKLLIMKFSPLPCYLVAILLNTL
jgi:hypothetical protein